MMKKLFFEKNRVYLDYNASTPLFPKAICKIKKGFQYYGNPSSVHQDAAETKACIWRARQNIARFIGCDPLEIIFTSGASESNNYILKGLTFSPQAQKRKEIIISAVEHSSIVEPVRFLAQQGFTVHVVPVSKKGELDKDFFHKALSENTLVVSIMGVNNETGIIFPLEELIQATHKSGALFHSDMVQVLGKQALNLHKLGVDAASFSGHKFYSLKGSGFLYCRKGLSLSSLVHGGSQERKRRAGTENVMGIISLGEVAKEGPSILKKTQDLKILRDSIESKLQSEFPDIQVVGQDAERVSTTSSFIIPGVDGETLLINLDLKGFSVSSGSACSSGKLDVSSVLKAMNFTEVEARSSMRVSLGLGITERDVDRFTKTTIQAIRRLKSINKIILSS